MLSQAYLENGVPQNKTSLLAKVKRKMLPLKNQRELRVLQPKSTHTKKNFPSSFR
jgi:hypothetical protein